MDQADATTNEDSVREQAELLASPDPAVAMRAARQLRQMALRQTGAAIEKAVPSLIQALNTEHRRLWSEVVYALTAIGRAARPAGPRLFQVVKGEDAGLRDEAANAIRSLFDLTALDNAMIIGYDDYEAFLRSNGLSDPLPPSHSKFPIERLLADLPKDTAYPELLSKLASLSHEFRMQVAARLQPALNAHLQTIPHETLDQKKELARSVNSELERFGLAVKCPKTGLPGKLRGITGHWQGVGRFAIEVYSDGKQKTPTISDTLPELELTDSIPPATAPEGPWEQRVGPKSRRAGRKLD